MRDTSALRATIAGLRGEFEDKLAALVEIPSVSMDPSRRSDMDRCADLATSYLRDIGAEVTRIDTGGLPLLLGRIHRDPTFPTITVYNHLDVQPADPREWKSPPFTFTRDGDRWLGRGTTDDKGPALSALYGAKLALDDGAHANVQFLWELEEEIGSPHFEAGLRTAATGEAGLEPLDTDAVVVSDTIWISAGRPAIPYGLRGLMGFTIRLQTGAKDVHSGTTGGAARNPIGELAALLTECYDARTGKVKIPGFYQGVRKLTAAEKKGFARAGFTRKRFQAAHELASVRFKDDARLMEAIMAAPTFEVHGLVGGYTGPGIKTIVPHAAEAKVSTRLVPDQNPAKVFKLIKDFVRKRLPDAEVTHESTLEPYLGELGGSWQDLAVRTMKETFGREPALTREGGSIGAVLTMKRLLGKPIVFLGLSLPEHGYHAINENFDWGQASGGMEMFYRYFHEAHRASAPATVARRSVAARRSRAIIQR
jgi:acetylornithine deacetylase/succinyl-diaminopimelate desuccinylase-like protein